MRRTISFCIAFGLAFVAPSFTQAANHKANIKYHHGRVVQAASRALVMTSPQRVCDWVGPGGRAVYRCTVVDPAQPTAVVKDMPHHPVCGWVGPAAPPRAIYACM